MKIYVSGKITGLDLEVAHQNFDVGVQYLKAQGFEPINPMDLVPYHPDLTWKDYMRADIKALCDCDGILMISGWRKSKGAKLERHIAKSLGLNIMYLHTNAIKV